MKKLLLLLSVIFIVSFSYGQGSVPKGSSQLNVGVGLSGWGVPVYIGIDHGISRDFTIGGEVSFRSYRENWKNDYYRHSIIGISGNVNYHFNRILDIPDEWDFYGGANLGFYIWNSPNNYSGSNSTGLGLGLQLGGRYYLSEKVGLNLELGSGNAFSNGKFGITVKL